MISLKTGISRWTKNRRNLSVAPVKEWKTSSFHSRVKSNDYRRTPKTCRNNWFKLVECQNRFPLIRHWWSSQIYVPPVPNTNSNRGPDQPTPRSLINIAITRMGKEERRKTSGFARRAFLLKMRLVQWVWGKEMSDLHKSKVSNDRTVWLERWVNHKFPSEMWVLYSWRLYKWRDLHLNNNTNFSLLTSLKTVVNEESCSCFTSMNAEKMCDLRGPPIINMDYSQLNSKY